MESRVELHSINELIEDGFQEFPSHHFVVTTDFTIFRDIDGCGPEAGALSLPVDLETAVISLSLPPSGEVDLNDAKVRFPDRRKYWLYFGGSDSEFAGYLLLRFLHLWRRRESNPGPRTFQNNLAHVRSQLTSSIPKRSAGLSSRVVRKSSELQAILHVGIRWLGNTGNPSPVGVYTEIGTRTTFLNRWLLWPFQAAAASALSFADIRLILE
jgi:hypothetical protein